MPTGNNTKLREAQVKVLVIPSYRLRKNAMDAKLRMGNQTFVTEALVAGVVALPFLGSEFLKHHKAKTDMQKLWLEHTNGMVQVDLIAKGNPEKENYLTVAAIS